ncbi:uncharacterized protein LOC132193875 [Neocloeon triangulifer]|uniref:uncharacterized protein LOC132193875 n=1 Tax=Neocloeon triangulifer TaxID=2078957 RepID=UPI00286F6424|nr:uncharacterized protein LOC132193875 [Neocloeon triangulifer]XP_059470795.1 uncharacterized protein LOC132193875 [Neocloeon triangulifer]XP_059470796.1 uncharacterized protein LOC132193875 [Neocloeon triangulifer]
MKEEALSCGDAKDGVLLRNLRCLVPSAADGSPPPCPPPSSNCSSAASSPRPSESPEPAPKKQDNNETESDSGHSSNGECPDTNNQDGCPDLFGVIDKIATVLDAKCPEISQKCPDEFLDVIYDRPERPEPAEQNLMDFFLQSDSESDEADSQRPVSRLHFIDEEDEEEEEEEEEEEQCSLLDIVGEVDSDGGSEASVVLRAPLAAAEADEGAQKPAGSIIEESPSSPAVRVEQSTSAAAAAAAASPMRQKDSDGGKDGGGGNNNHGPCTEACVASECCWNDECLERGRPKSIIRKTPGHASGHKRRVTFNENCNKFFDADYVILVGEDCNGDETTRLVSMCKKQPNQQLPDAFPTDLCPFDQALDFVDHQVTLSPPEGYKDVLGTVRQDDESESESSGEAQDEDGCQSPICEQCSACSACASQHQQQQRYIVETITLTTVTERRIVREAGDQEQPQLSGILKGGKLWKNCSDSSSVDTASSPASDDGESSALVRRSVRFSEEDEEKDSDRPVTIEEVQHLEDPPTPPAELNLTLRLGSVLLNTDKLPPNSAVRQLFPDTKQQKRLLSISDDTFSLDGKELRSPSTGGSNSDDELSRGSSSSIKRTIERNALRRSLLRYSDPVGSSRRRSVPNKDENSLVERIKQLTCDFDEEPFRSESPNQQYRQRAIVGRERCHSESGKDFHQPLQLMQDNSCCWLMVDPPRGGIKMAAAARKQVHLGERETPPDGSASASVNTAMAPDGTIYSLDDIDEVLANECVCPPPEHQQPPDILATVQQQQQQQDELAMFVQRDLGRIERLKKRYSLTEEDDQDDYGFSRRPSVRGIKPRFGSTTEIIQQIQLQLQPPPLANPGRTGSHVTWPYPPDNGSSSTSSPVLSPTEQHPRRRTQPPIPIRGSNLPLLSEDPYYATVPAQDYRYVEYTNGAAYVYASSYPSRSDVVPYSESPPTRYLPSTAPLPPPQRRAPVVYAPYAAQQQVQQRLPYRSESPQRYYYPSPQQQQQRFYQPAPYPGKYPAALPPPQQNDLPSPSAALVRALSPVPADSPTRNAIKFERGAPEGASASPGFPQQDFYAANRAGVVSADGDQQPPTSQQQHLQQQNSSVYYAMNV